VFIAIATIVQSGIAGVSTGLVEVLAGDYYALGASIFQLLLALVLAILAIYLALNMLDKFTKGIQEFEELKKGNVAVALVMAGVIITVAIIIQEGVKGITSGLI